MKFIKPDIMSSIGGLSASILFVIPVSALIPFGSGI